MPLSAVDAGANAWSSANASGSGDDIEIPAEILAAGVSAALDRVRFRRNQVRIHISGTAPGRFSRAVEDSGLLLFEDPSADPATLIAAVQGFGGYWRAASGQYRINSDAAFLVGSRRTLDDFVIGKAVGDIVRMRIAQPDAVRIGARLGLAGTGRSGVAVAGPAPVRLHGRLGIAGLGTSSLRVVPGVRMASRLGIAGLGAGRLNVAQPASVRPRGRLEIVGIGTSGLKVDHAEVTADQARVDARSLAGRNQIFALEVEHPAIDRPVRVVADTVAHVIEGERYIPLAFRAHMPQSKEHEVRTAGLRIDNVGRELMAWVEASDGGRDASMRVMRVIPPAYGGGESIVGWEVTMTAAVAEITNEYVAVSLTSEPVFGRPSVIPRHDPSTSPGLFIG